MGEGPVESVDDDDIEECFSKAADYVELHASHGQLGCQDDMLKLYGLFKQATQGPCTAPRPSFLNQKGRSKWSAWHSLGGMSSKDAKLGYIECLSSMKPEWNEKILKKETRAGPVFSSLVHNEDVSEDHSQGLALLDAARDGKVDSVLAILRSRESSISRLVDQKDEDGCTALHWAADRGQDKVIQILVDEGANICACDNDGLTPLQYAAIAEQLSSFKLLLKAGADLSSALEYVPDDWKPKFCSG